ncbi:hypothetical protein QQ045_006791 [Rhodiola kirilowii]
MILSTVPGAIGSVESSKGVVAADEGRCSEIGVAVLRSGGHAVDAAVATALCLGVVNPLASGIGGGSFMIVRSEKTSKVQAYNMRETAPMAASEDMYDNDPKKKLIGALAMGVPGEIAGLHKAWEAHGRMPWKNLFQPAINLAKNGFIVAPYLAQGIEENKDLIMADPGLKQVFAPNGKLLKSGDKCHNVQLSRSLEVIALQGPGVFYNGSLGEKIVEEVRKAGGILTMDDLRSYKVDEVDPLKLDVMGFTIYGMPPPSSGTVGLSLVLNIFKADETKDVLKGLRGLRGLHRLIEAIKHMFAIRMNLGDPKFVDISSTVSKMLSPTYAEKIRAKILDNTTFPPEYYNSSWSQLQDHGTSHFSIVDAEGNAVAMTTTVNTKFAAGMLLPSTGILLNNQMDDFSIPTQKSPDVLPPAPANFIRPGKRPLSSMTPLIIMKGKELIGVMGGSGGVHIVPAVIQVFINHFILGMQPEKAVLNPRFHHQLWPNVAQYENWTLINGQHIELKKKRTAFLKSRGHELQEMAEAAICQLISQKQEILQTENVPNMPKKKRIFIAVSDPRKDGKPAAV